MSQTIYTIHATAAALEWFNVAKEGLPDLKVARELASKIAAECGETVHVRDVNGKSVAQFNYDGSEA